MKAKVKFSQQTFKVENETVLLDSLLKTCMDCYRDFTSTLTHFCTTCDLAYLLGCDNTLKLWYSEQVHQTLSVHYIKCNMLSKSSKW